VRWALDQGVNPDDTRFTTLGSILKPLFQEVGLKDASSLAAMIAVYHLYRDRSLLEDLRLRYQIPQLASATARSVPDHGPDIDWLGPSDEEELQSWLRPAPDVQDVGVLRLAIERAASVCLVETNRSVGTGFLLPNNLLLTNYHVLKPKESVDIEENARSVRLHFGYYTSAGGVAAQGQQFKLACNNPILKGSPSPELDYVLLHVDDSIAQAKDISPAPYDLEPPERRTGLNILQHPERATMKLAITHDGVTGVYRDRGKVQYVTTTATGSSGAPCFNEDWNVVALHRSQRGRGILAVREGVLFGSIHKEIKDYL